MRDGVKEFSFHAPSSWQELTEMQKRYVLSVLSMFQDHTVVKCYLLTRFCDIKVHKHTRTGWKCSALCQVGQSVASKKAKSSRNKVKTSREVFYLKDAEILSLLKNFDFIDDFTDYYPLETCQGMMAVERLLRDISFGDYLQIEKNYQLYMMKQQDKFLAKMATLLYRTKSGETDEAAHFEAYELLNVFMWFSCVKGYFAANFTHFFKPAKSGEEIQVSDLMGAIQAQIRALTDGDISKRTAVMDANCWDALTELDAKAREAEEFKQRQNK